ncbi:MAG: hypothetical protein ACRDG4_02600 [Chloroflexota bacterium]
MHPLVNRTLYRTGVSIALAGLASSAMIPSSWAASAAPQNVRYGGPAVGFTVQVPAGWPIRQAGDAGKTSELVFAGPKGSGLSAVVGRQATQPNQPLSTALPNHSLILHQRPLSLSWGTGTESILLQDSGTAATGNRGQSLELHAVLTEKEYLYHLALSTAPGHWPDQRQTADAAYRTMLNSLTPIHATPAIQIEQAAAMVGAGVAVRGAGWPAGARISFSLGAVNTGAGGNYGTVTADEKGSFSTMVAPARYPDGSPIKTPSTVVLVAYTAGWTLKATAPIMIAKPQVSADRVEGPVGTAIALRGLGWPEGTGVTVSLGGVNTGAGGNYGGAIADAAGRFTIHVKPLALPNGAPLKPSTIGLVVHNADSSLKAVVQFNVTGR